jgi:PKD repeat protein
MADLGGVLMNFIKSLKFANLVLFLVFLVISPGCGGITTPGISQDTLSAAITANPTSGEAPLEVTFDASESSAAQGNEIASYKWDFGDGKTGEGGTVYHGFDSPGNYTVVLTISDDKGTVDTSSVTIEVFQPTETVVEREFDSQNGIDFDTGTGLKIIIPPTPIEGQVNLEVKYDSSPSQSASDFMNLHSSYSISLIPQKGFQEKELITSGINKDQETTKVSFIFDVPEDVDPQSLAIFEWTDEGWCLAGAGDIETIEQLGGVLSFDGTQISIEIPNFSNYSKYLNSKDLQNTLGSIKLSLCNFANNLTANIPICPLMLPKPEEKHEYYIEQEIEFRSLDLGVLGYGRGICYKVGWKDIENLIGDPVWEQPYTSDLIKIVDPFGEYLIPTNDWEKPGVLTLKFGTEGGECTVWLEANQGAIVKKWLLSAIPYVGYADVLWRNIINISDAFNDDVLGHFFGHSIGYSALIKETREMIKDVARELIKEGLGSFIPGLTLGVSIGELNASIITYQETVYSNQNPCNYKKYGYWEWRIIVLPITNNLPVANAGTDQTVQVGILVNLDGTASYDNDGDALIYNWTQIKGPEIVNLSDSNIPNPAFTPTKVGVYEFELIVNDGKDNSEPDNVIINVTESTTTPPSAPTSLSPGTTSAPGPIISTLTPTLQWQAVSNADYYNLSVSIYPYGTSNIIYYNLYGNSITIPSGKLEAGKKYRWNMRAYNSAGYSEYSSDYHFQTESITTKPDAPTSLSPGTESAPGPYINTLTPTLQWQAVSNVTLFTIISRYTEILLPYPVENWRQERNTVGICGLIIVPAVIVSIPPIIISRLEQPLDKSNFQVLEMDQHCHQ